MKKELFLLGLCLISGTFVSQDFSLINTSQSLTYLNPSFAGSNGGIRTQVLYRSQPSFFNQNVTFASYDMYLKQSNGGVAVSNLFGNLGNGYMVNQAFNVSYAQYFNFLNGDLNIIPAIQVGYLKREVNFEKVNFASSYYNTFISDNGLNTSTRQNLNLTSSVLVNYKSLYIGGSFSNINRPNVGPGAERLPVNIHLNASYSYALTEKNILHVNTVLIKQGYCQSLRLGVGGLFFNHVLSGAGLTNTGYYLNCGYKANKFSLGFSADVTNRGLFQNYSSVSYGSYEFFASFNLPGNNGQKSSGAALEKF